MDSATKATVQNDAQTAASAFSVHKTRAIKCTNLPAVRLPQNKVFRVEHRLSRAPGHFHPRTEARGVMGYAVEKQEHEQWSTSPGESGTH